MARLNYFQTKPKVQRIPVDEYLKRINVEKDTPSIEYLNVLHKAHLLNIPFENLDVIFNQKPILDIPRFYKKIITNKRGGISFELNLLFYHLLDSLGFTCYLISARKYVNNSMGPGFDHPLIVVSIKNEYWLVDVGSISLFVEPIKIVANQLQLDYNQYFRFEQDPDENYLLKKSSNSIEFQQVYQFDLKPKEIIQFLERFHFYYESPESPLKQQKLIFQHTTSGKVQLTDNLLIHESMGDIVKTAILQEDDFVAKLQEYFKLDYDLLFRQRFK